jgi:biotin-dependent carboxylase-like uncharacterized protein
MTPALRVVAGGVLATLQDLGRPGHQHLGVSVGGALDPFSLYAANALVGNPPGTTVIEVAGRGPTLAVEADDVRLAVVGAQASIEILPDEATASATRVAAMRSMTLRRGEMIRIGALTAGGVLYLAAEGGFDIAPVLGSSSACLRGGFGGLLGRALAVGDRLPLRRPRASTGGEVEFDGLDLALPARIRAVPGPQNDHFTAQGIATFFASDYTIGPASSRMGLCLAGPRIAHARGHDIVSDALAPGSVQVPGDGQPIVLLADRATTGGYPKIATVISADLPALGRLPVGARIGFEAVTLESAVAARRRLLDEIKALTSKIVPQRQPSVMAARLHDCNLISGVADAAA